MRSHWAFLLALILGDWVCCGTVSAEPIIAVFTSETGPYQEVLAGLKQELKTGVQPGFLSQGEPKIPRSARVVLAFGSKAALKKYPEQTVIIYAMAPGLVLESPNAIQICMEPDASTLLANLRKIQPSLKRLGILWKSPRFEVYVERLRELGASSSLTIEGVAVESGKDIPDHLRAMYGKVDAVWLPPDPLLLNGESLPVFIEFSKANHIPLFVPTGGLVAQGATASVGPSFREIGRVTAIAAQKALESRAQDNTLYPINIEIVINKTVAAQVGLQISEEVFRKADKVIP